MLAYLFVIFTTINCWVEETKIWDVFFKVRHNNNCTTYVCVCELSFIHLFVTPWTIALQAPLTMEFSRQEYWSRLPFPTPGDLHYPGIESESSVSTVSPALAGRFFTPEPSGKPIAYVEVQVLITQSCPTLCDPTDCTLAGSSLHERIVL